MPSATDQNLRNFHFMDVLWHCNLDRTARTKIITDASPVGLGAVLLQEQKEENRVISYASRGLSEVERRYSQTGKEGLGIVWACERFQVYLYGVDFELWTDHKPLEFIYSARSRPSARIERWVLWLQPYQEPFPE